MTQRRDWGEQREAARNLRRFTGSSPAYLLLESNRLRLGVLLGAPRHAAIIVTSPSGGSSSDGIVVIDTDGSTPAEAIAQITSALLESCGIDASCVTLSTYIRLPRIEVNTA